MTIGPDPPPRVNTHSPYSLYMSGSRSGSGDARVDTLLKGSGPSSRRPDYAAVLSPPARSNLSPPSPTNEMESAAAAKLPPFEDFEVMIGDVRRIFSTWMHNSQSGFKSARQELLNEQRRLEEMKAKMLREVEELKKHEFGRIKETRLKAEQEMASMAKQIASEREASRQSIADEKKKLDLERQTAKQSLRLEQNRLARDIEALEEERRRIVDANIATQTMVELNVGGSIFETSRQVLTQFKDSYLGALFSGRHEVERDRNGRIFIDRDSGLFRQILNFLRNPEQVVAPRDETESDMLCQEARFYGISFFPYPQTECFIARMYFAGGAIHNRVYVAGGQNLEYKALCDVECYDGLRDTWTAAPALLTPRKSVAGAVVNERLFAVGGFDSTDILSSVEYLDPRCRSWVEVSPMNTPRSSAMVVSKDHQLFVLGGTSGERLRSAEVYDTRMNRWEVLPREMMEIRSGGCGAILYDSIFALGGIDGGQRVHDTTEVYELLGEPQWRYRKSMEDARVDAAACVLSNTLMVGGGQAYGAVLGSVKIFRPELDEWHRGPDFMTPRFGHILASANI